ncbi:hypothetical protein ASE01_08760 [Nocardioides sp. Root190]|uniref:DUF4350 domain-containing protein n=1 Tax=Nocardioides sp. Root190 TaxID=1736488 RepID=UPI000701E00C|nr:DUF4350 domain-containing protein [Nocardioides sp. Root190]KRB76852.1 hypothetical protein ASE01_08760 [Nocardioides sp. Root190]
MSGPRPVRGWLLIGIALLLALGVAVWTTNGSERYPTPLDPRNPGPEGAQALAEVLEDEGVDVEVVRSAEVFDETAIDDRTTVLVTATDGLSPSTLERMRNSATAGRIVLVDPAYALVREINKDLQAITVFPDALDAECTGSPGLDGFDGLDGLRLEVDQLTVLSDDGAGGPLDGAACFAASGGSALAEVSGENLVLFGAGDALGNDQVTRADNAAIALRLAGGTDRLVWYVPDPTDAEADEAVAISSLLPRWIGPGLWLTALALVALVLWRARRLGPLSTEPLPVVVRAVETARSRGRMYRRSGDREHVARSLRRAARNDLAARLRLDRRAEPAAVVEAAARHLGVAAEPLDTLLNDHRPPASDQDLVRLAEELARLRREVRRG